MKQITDLRKKYQDELQITVSNIGQLQKSITAEKEKLEQLKGAIFALDSAMAEIERTKAAALESQQKADEQTTAEEAGQKTEVHEEKKEEAKDGSQDA